MLKTDNWVLLKAKVINKRHVEVAKVKLTNFHTFLSNKEKAQAV